MVETLRATLHDLATMAPEWLGRVTPSAWCERYAPRAAEDRLPKGKPAREAYALQVGQDGFHLLAALEQEPTLGERSSVCLLRQGWRQHDERTETGYRWRKAQELPPVGERLCSRYDPETHFSDKRSTTWAGYKVHFTETCDTDAVRLVIHTQTCLSMIPDVASTADIHQKLAEND